MHWTIYCRNEFHAKRVIRSSGHCVEGRVVSAQSLSLSVFHLKRNCLITQITIFIFSTWTISFMPFNSRPTRTHVNPHGPCLDGAMTTESERRCPYDANRRPAYTIFERRSRSHFSHFHNEISLVPQAIWTLMLGRAQIYRKNRW